MAYKELPIVQVGLDQLMLDLDNYRIPTHRDDQAETLKYLFASEDVLSTAKMILRDGYFDNEVPIVVQGTSVQEGFSSYIVLEGNRRVSALKALRDPAMAPDYEAQVRDLLKRYAVEAESLPERIRVFVAPDRDTAAPHIARLHTGISKKRWSRDQQATFYYSLLDERTTVEDVKARYPDVDVPRFIKMAVMRRFLTGVRFSDPRLCEYVAGNDLAMSAFEYAYLKAGIAAAIGIKFDKSGMLLPLTSTPESIALNLPENNLRALEYLIGEFRAKRLNTRSAEFKTRGDAHQPFVDHLNRIASHTPPSPEPSIPAPSDPSPDSRGKSPSTVDEPKTQSTASDQHAQPVGEKSRGPNHPDTKDKLDLSGLDYENAPINLKLRYIELRKISLSSFPIAAAILLRSTLESTIKIHFENTDKPATGELKSAFARVEETYKSQKSLKSTINTIKSGGEDKPGSITWFNLIAHNAEATVDSKGVRQAWKVVNPLLRRLLRPPSDKIPR